MSQERARRRRVEIVENTRVVPGDSARGEIQILEARVRWENDVARVYEDRVRFPAHDGEDGAEGSHFRLAHAPGRLDGVVIVPVTHDDRILLVRQFRHPVRMWIRELPRGGRESGETPEEAARRELREEIGREAESLHPLGRLAPDSGQQEGYPYLFVARVGERGDTAREDSEAIDRIFAYSYSELRQAAESGDIVDAFTVAAVTRLAPHFEGDRLRYRRDRAPARQE